MEQQGAQAPAGDGVECLVLVVELQFFEYPALRGGRAGDHEAELACDVEVTAPVVTEIQHEIRNAPAGQVFEGIDEFPFRGGDEVVEQQVTHGPRCRFRAR